jgi:hypothetical protein
VQSVQVTTDSELAGLRRNVDQFIRRDRHEAPDPDQPRLPRDRQHNGCGRSPAGAIRRTGTRHARQPLRHTRWRLPAGCRCPGRLDRRVENREVEFGRTTDRAEWCPRLTGVGRFAEDFRSRRAARRQPTLQPTSPNPWMDTAFARPAAGDPRPAPRGARSARARRAGHRQRQALLGLSGRLRSTHRPHRPRRHPARSHARKPVNAARQPTTCPLRP